MEQNDNKLMVQNILKNRNRYLVSVGMLPIFFIGIVVFGKASDAVVTVFMAIAIPAILLQIPVFNKKCPSCGKSFFIIKIMTKPFTNKCVNCGFK